MSFSKKIRKQVTTTNEILAYIHDLKGFVASGLVNSTKLIEKGNEEWIKAEVVERLHEEAIKELKQKLQQLDARSLVGWNKEKHKGNIGGHAVFVLLFDVEKLLEELER